MRIGVRRVLPERDMKAPYLLNISELLDVGSGNPRSDSHPRHLRSQSLSISGLIFVPICHLRPGIRRVPRRLLKATPAHGLESRSMAEMRNTRERLLEAAISIIEAEGEDGVRVDRVAEIAGFTKPVVYHHFADREDMVIAALSERYYRSISFAVDEIKFAAARCRTAAQFVEVLQKAIESFSTPEGIHRRQLRIEALGAAVSRPVLQASLIEANRRQAEAFGEVLQIAQEEGWLRVGVNTVDLAAWWTALMLSRHLIEIDAERFDPGVWTQITSWTVGMMIGEPDGSR